MAETSLRIPFRIHPRVFAALGSDLVTSDVIAIIELVKNSYDAFASRVDVAFRTDAQGARTLEIMDDGLGMDRTVIEDAWCVVATPFRKGLPTTTRDGKSRAVSGEKGLGRLSAARLGRRLDLLTQMKGQPCWSLKVDWAELAKSEDIAGCGVTCELVDHSPFRVSGTRITIFDLESEWQEEQLADLKENLSRLLAPFKQEKKQGNEPLGKLPKDFVIFLTEPDGNTVHEPIQIRSPEFLDKPPYAIRGHVTKEREVIAKYEFAPLDGGEGREANVSRSWKGHHRSC